MNDNLILLACIAGAIAFTILILTIVVGLDGIRDMWRKDIKDDSNDDDKGDIHKVNY